MTRGRKGTAFATSDGGAQVFEAPSAYSSAQVVKAKTPKKRTPKASSDPADGSDRGAAGSSGGATGKKRPRTASWEREYQQIWKTVNDLGAEQFTGKDKKAYEARKIVERGGRAPKEARMPYVMLQGIRKKGKQREETRELMEAAAGLVTGNTGSGRRKSAQTPRGRGGGGGGGGGGSGSRGGNDRTTSSFGPAPSMGMMKSGVLHISRNSAPPGVRKRMSEAGRGGRGGGGGGGRGRGGGRGASRGGGRGGGRSGGRGRG